MNARLTGGSESRRVSPHPRSQRNGKRSFEKTRTSASVIITPPARSRRRGSNTQQALAGCPGSLVAAEYFGQLPGIAQAEIEALSGHRMQCLRGVSEQQSARRRRWLRDAQREREGRASFYAQ